jgi:hypothetical protein
MPDPVNSLFFYERLIMNSKIRIGFTLVLLALLISTAYAQDSGPSATRVFGQADFTGNAIGHGGDGMSYPLGLAADGQGGIYLADRDNHRVLYFALDGDIMADRVYGQHGNLNTFIANNDGAGNSGKASPDSLNMPTAVALDSTGGLYITDRDNHRVLYFAPDGNTTADRIYGQHGNFATNMVNNDGTVTYGEPSADSLGTYILGVAVDKNDGLYVSDSSSHRVLYYINDGDSTADRVYGQFGDFTTDARNNDSTGRRGTPSADSFNFPRGLAVDENNGLYVADRDNNRILYFADDGNTTADRVYGQFGSFTTNVESNDGSGNVGEPNTDNLSHPKAITVQAGSGIYVADTLHHRVLFFGGDDTTADFVFGQSQNFTTGAINNGGTVSEDSMNGPQGLLVTSDGLLYVADTGNNRMLQFQLPVE